jgi:hypothetical protein
VTRLFRALRSPVAVTGDRGATRLGLTLGVEGAGTLIVRSLVRKELGGRLDLRDSFLGADVFPA